MPSINPAGSPSPSFTTDGAAPRPSRHPTTVSNVSIAPGLLHGMNHETLSKKTTDELIDMFGSWDHERSPRQNACLRLGLGSLFPDPVTKDQLRLLLHLATRDLSEQQRDRLKAVISRLPRRLAAHYLDEAICRRQTHLFGTLCNRLLKLQAQDLGQTNLTEQLLRCHGYIAAIPDTALQVQNRRNARYYSPQVAGHMADLNSRLRTIKGGADTLGTATAANRDAALQMFKEEIKALVR